MKVDIGFWNEQGEYIPDIQEVSEVEMSNDKKIKIDGVDVAGCVRLQDDKTSCDLGGECKGWENCYYKQLKRLEQENAELKWENEKIKLSNNNLRLALDTYKMPEVVKVLTDWRTGELDLRINKYKQTLQEIKAIAKTGMHCEGMGCDFMPKILDLITKAEEE